MAELEAIHVEIGEVLVSDPVVSAAFLLREDTLVKLRIAVRMGLRLAYEIGLNEGRAHGDTVQSTQPDATEAIGN